MQLGTTTERVAQSLTFGISICNGSLIVPWPYSQVRVLLPRYPLQGKKINAKPAKSVGSYWTRVTSNSKTNYFCEFGDFPCQVPNLGISFGAKGQHYVRQFELYSQERNLVDLLEKKRAKRKWSSFPGHREVALMSFFKGSWISRVHFL